MSFKESLQNKQKDFFMKKYGDRLSSLQGNVISVKVEEKAILWIFHKLTATILVRPERSKNIAKCVYKRNRWFKKPSFMQLSIGNMVIVMGLKGAKGKKNAKQSSEVVQVSNIINMTTRKELDPKQGGLDMVKKAQKVQRIRQ